MPDGDSSNEEHLAFHKNIAALQEHQRLVEEQNSTDHATILATQQKILSRLDQREGAEKVVRVILWTMCSIGLAPLAALIANHFNLLWPDVQITIKPLIGGK